MDRTTSKLRPACALAQGLRLLARSVGLMALLLIAPAAALAVGEGGASYFYNSGTNQLYVNFVNHATSASPIAEIDIAVGSGTTLSGPPSGGVCDSTCPEPGMTGGVDAGAHSAHVMFNPPVTAGKNGDFSFAASADPGSVLVTLKFQDGSTQQLTATTCGTIVYTPNPLPHVPGDMFFSLQLNGQGGVAPYLWSLNGVLPAGVSLSPDGVLSGTPTAAGESTGSFVIIDGNGCSGFPPYDLVVDQPTAPAPVTITTTLSTGFLAGKSITIKYGDPFTDAAVLHGANVAHATGKVMLTIYSGTTCSGDLLEGVGVTLTGYENGETSPLRFGGVVPLAPGVYSIKASYEGDFANAAATSCDETLTVQGVSPPPPPPPPGPPQVSAGEGLLIGLRTLDGIIDVGAADGRGEGVRVAAERAEAAKLSIADAYLTASVDGTPLNTIFTHLDCIDAHAAAAAAYQHKHGNSSQAAKGALLEGRRCATELEDLFRKDFLPVGTTVAQKIYEQFVRALGQVRRDQSIGLIVTKISYEKAQLVHDQLNVAVDGLKFEDFYTALDCIDSRLAPISADPSDHKHARKAFAAAIACKALLERKLAGATGAPASLRLNLALLDKLLAAGETAAAGDEGKNAALDAGNAKQMLVDAYLTESVNGLALSKLFTGLDCIDRHVAAARAAQHVFGDGSSYAKDQVDLALKCAQQLGHELSASGFPVAASQAIQAISEKLNDGIAAIEPKHALDRLPISINDDKEALVKSQLNVAVGGLTFDDYFQSLDCVDGDLAAAYVDLSRNPPNLHAAALAFGDAARCKLALERKVKGAG